MLNAILNSVTQTNIESKDTSLQYFFISLFLLKTKLRSLKKVVLKSIYNIGYNSLYMYLYLIYFSFTSYAINTDGKTNNKHKQGANRDLNPRKADPLKLSYSTWQLF